MRRIRMILMVLAISLFVGLQPAGSAPARVVIDDRSPALDEQEGGGWERSLGFTNLTDAEMTVSVEATDKSDV